MSKINYIGKIFLGMFLVTLLLGFANAVTLAEWDFDNESLNPSIDRTSSAEFLISDSRDDHYVGGNPGRALSVRDWNIAERFLEVSLESSDYKDLILKFDEQNGTLQNVTEFKIQYSSDGSTFVDFGELINISQDFGDSPMHTFNFSSISALNDKSLIKFRIVLPGAASTESGTWHFDNVKVEATEIDSSSTAGDPEEIKDCKDIGNRGSNLVVEIKDISVNSGFGKDEQWQVFDEIEVEVRVKNTGSDYIENIHVNWGVYNTKLESWLVDDEENDFDLDSRESETLAISFKLDDFREIKDAVDEGALDKYLLYVWVEGEDEEYDFDETCEFDYEKVKIKTERDFVVLKDITPDSTAKCGENLEISGKVWNIGSRDQKNVSVYIYNKELGISQTVAIGDLDAFKESKSSLFFSYKLPENLTQKNYQIKYTVLDRRGDIYETSDDKTSVFYSTLKIDTCDIQPDVSVDASLESQAKAGKALVIKAIITNTGSQTRGYSLNLKGYSSWAEVESIEPATFILEAEESKEVLISLKVNRDAEGEKTLEAEVYSEGTFIYSQPIALSIKPAFNFDLASWFSNLSAKENWYLWAIALVNLALVVTIIVVAIKVMKK